MNDSSFDELLTALMSQEELHTEQCLKTNPFHHAMVFIIVGMCLTFFELRVSYYAYLLPFLGYLCLSIGLYLLHKENKYLHFGWIGACFRLCILSIQLCLVATSYGGIIEEAPVVIFINLLDILVVWLYTKGLHDIFLTQEKRTNIIYCLYVVMKVIVVVGFLYALSNGLLLTLISVLYALIVVQIFKLNKDLQEQGYPIQICPVKAPITEQCLKTNPIHHAMVFIIVGMCLTFFELKVSYYAYLLPFFGYLCLSIGFYLLHKENKYLLLGWIGSCFRLCIFSIQLCLLATPYGGIIEEAPAAIFINLLDILVVWLYTKGLHDAFLIQEKRSRIIYCLYIIMKAMVVVGFYSAPNNGLLLTLILVLYALIIVQIFKLNKDLQEQGYHIQICPIKIPIYAIIVGYCCVQLLCIFSLLYAFTHMQQATYQPVPQSLLEDERSSLIEKGLPTQLVEDLLDEDVMALQAVSSFDHERSDFGNDTSIGHVTIDLCYGYTKNNTMEALVYYQVEDNHQEAMHSIRFDVDHVDSSLATSISEVLLHDQVQLKEHNGLRVYAKTNQITYGSSLDKTRGYQRVSFRKDPQFQLGLHAQYQRQQRWFQYPYQSFVHQEHDSVGMTSSQYSTYNYRIFIFDQNSTQFLE